MKNHGFKLSLTLFFIALSAFYLFPTFRAYFQNRKIESLEGEAREEYVQENYGKIQNVREDAMKLGLDLQGGMHVGLEVRIEELIRELATDRDQLFDQALAAAVQQAQTGDASIINTFVNEIEQRDPNVRLSRYFRNDAAGITRRSSNADVQNYLQTEADEAVNRAIEIVRQRVDRFGVSEPSIQKQGNRRIAVELPGVDDPERVRNLLRGTARLEFRLTAEPAELQRALTEIVQLYETTPPASADTAAQRDTTAQNIAAAGDSLAQADTGAATAGDDSFSVGQIVEGENAQQAAGGNPLLAVMQPVGQGVEFGIVAEQDTATVNRLLSDSRAQAALPPGVQLMYTSGQETEDGQEIFTLVGVRDQVELTGEVITDARVDFSQTNNAAEVSMTMNTEGARDWSRITGANVGKPVAIVLDEVVYSYPTVINRIPGGQSSITGLESQAEAEDIVTILKSGALPAPVEIINERTVGPSLGAESIRAGILCVIVGLLAVGIFMVVYYRSAGVVADLALILNVIFILGLLSAFDATLTLPGIAGMVLTFAAAVDANVLIFERMREERDMGKSIGSAVQGGFTKAFSGIFDSQVTTFLIGAILYSFGSGPIRGFAVTLMFGIAASVFGALVFTRLIVDWMVNDRKVAMDVG